MTEEKLRDQIKSIVQVYGNWSHLECKSDCGDKSFEEVSINDEVEALLDTTLKAIKESREENRKTKSKVIDWATGSDTGSSSKDLCRFMVGLLPVNGKVYQAPCDSDDRGRCIRLLNKIPEWWERLVEMEKLPSQKINIYSSGELRVEERGWKEQIPLVREEAKLSTTTNQE